ncbi:PAS domain-containing hybrid sensor histidine kinase/response regulator [Idiomarina seosinensis]|uniref:histidine kinase n=1 Tax=Idiomarina seosinensis TaxID=281739 RepID=A0A432ZIE1_9GAMM|nr:PAS domain-containing protein [Idiomarina seosinensis]RUO77731.1 hybrid sensor histidine kinase/response regulator [Idiomarina seosinensis]
MTTTLYPYEPEPVTGESLEELINAGTGLSVFVWEDTELWPVRYVSENVSSVFGYSKEEFLRRDVHFKFLIHEDDHDRVNQEVELLKSGETGYRLTHQDYRVKHKQGHYVWVTDTTVVKTDHENNVYLLFGYLIDITERKELELRLETERNRLSLLLDATRLGTWEWNPQTGRTEFNQRWANIFGFELDELERDIKTWSNRVHEEDYQRVIDALTDHLQGRTPFYESEYRMLHRNGRWIYVLDRGRIIERDGNGDVLRYAGTITDVTEQKQAELDARRAAHAKNVFLANMSHEIRTPLHGILGLASVLEGTDVTPYQQGLLTTIKNSGDYLLNTLNDLLDLTRAEEGQLKIKLGTHSIEHILQHVRLLFEQRIKEKCLSFSLQVEGALPKQTITDHSRLIQIISNLVSNAIKFTDEGQIAIKAQWLAENKRKGELEIKIIDSGSGIRDTRRIWQLFEQEDDGLNKSQQGSGLGLAIVRNLVQLLSGTIQVDSELGEGSCFTVCLPMAVHFGGSLSHQQLAELPLPELPTMNILVVDDNTINQMIVREMLVSLGQQVAAVESGQQALEQLSAEVFDAIFMDLHMPGMDGMQTTQQIRALEIQQPYIIALTANAFHDTRSLALQSGMDDYLTKPFVKEDLAQVLNRIK